MKSDLNVDQIKKLWLLSLIVESGSLKSAASRAKVTPSAVSQALSALERNVGKPLLIRNKGEMLPTQEALEILGFVQPAFDAFERLNRYEKSEAPKMSWLNFGAYESIAVDLLPGLVHSLREKIPKLRLGLRVARTGQLLTMIRKGELCSALVTEVDDLDRFYSIEVAEDRLGVFVSKMHSSPALDLESLEKVGLGSLAPGKDGLPRYYLKFLKGLGSPKPNVLCESFETLRAVAASGTIAAILPLRVASRRDDLLEITPKDLLKDRGGHKIFVVSQLNCDRVETEFLAQEARRLLS